MAFPERSFSIPSEDYLGTAFLEAVMSKLRLFETGWATARLILVQQTRKPQRSQQRRGLRVKLAGFMQPSE